MVFRIITYLFSSYFETVQDAKISDKEWVLPIIGCCLHVKLTGLSLKIETAEKRKLEY